MVEHLNFDAPPCLNKLDHVTLVDNRLILFRGLFSTGEPVLNSDNPLPEEAVKTKR